MEIKIEKREIRAIIFTPLHKIEGNVQLFQKERLTDFINSPVGGDFITITEAKIFSPQKEDKLLFEADSMNVQKKYIIFISPFENKSE